MSTGPGAATIVVLLVFAGAVVLARRIERRPLLGILLVTGCVGGLGMLVGGTIDARLATSDVRPLCHAESGPSFALVSWMNGLMLLACVPACALLCPPCRGVRRWVIHVACTVGMLFGMVVGGSALGPALAHGLGARAGMHLAMVLGMVAGVAFAWPAANTMLGEGRR